MTQRVEVLNLAFHWLQQGLTVPEVIQRLTDATGLSARHAYRYVAEAHRLDAPLGAAEVKVVFTVRLPLTLAARLHQHAESTGQTLSHIVSQARWALMQRGGRV